MVFAGIANWAALLLAVGAGEAAGDTAALQSVAPQPTVTWSNLVTYDPGRTAGERIFRSAESCSVTPCVVTQDGAVRFNFERPGRFEISAWVLHRRAVTRIDYFEKRSFRDYFVLERMLNRKRNKKIWSIMERVENREIDTLYIYGATLQYDLDQGDPLVLEVVERDNPYNRRYYYFRLHKAGLQLRFDVALLFPINALSIPEPKPPYENSALNAAATLQFRWEKDPEADYSFLEKLVYSGHPTLFLGLLRRVLERPGEVPKRQSDIFVGAGITILDFFFAGWGANLINKPHTSGPFVGVHLRKTVNFVKDLNRSRPERWDNYLEEEAKRRIRVLD